MKGLKYVLFACLALVFCFTLASCNKGTCNWCQTQDVSRTKVKYELPILGEQTAYLCKDCYKQYKDGTRK